MAVLPEKKVHALFTVALYVFFASNPRLLFTVAFLRQFPPFPTVVCRWEIQSQAFRPTTGQPAASTSRRNQQYIQTRATVDQLLICIQSQDDVPVASYSAIAYPVDMVSRHKKSRSSEAWQPGAKYPVDKKTTVARSVVTKKRQQLSEQLLNNLLENIQPFNAINARDGRING
ncbi:glycerol-3-phosphate acyltransferase 1-like [Dorcoceras hygrometricum]|uniref:Glycerol-3-phosphate acyltransferase 1-like n=1 Tax=Dorcoceras hygrometricum TaxID=472368 RepID=A0A2Z7BY79_9LAMI|nr:glycerol-3-phosphate acyltransferase 1-like [Dorcoceras hygrometricum]